MTLIKNFFQYMRGEAEILCYTDPQEGSIEEPSVYGILGEKPSNTETPRQNGGSEALTNTSPLQNLMLAGCDVHPYLQGEKDIWLHQPSVDDLIEACDGFDHVGSGDSVDHLDEHTKSYRTCSSFTHPVGQFLKVDGAIPLENIEFYQTSFGKNVTQHGCETDFVNEKYELDASFDEIKQHLFEAEIIGHEPRSDDILDASSGERKCMDSRKDSIEHDSHHNCGKENGDALRVDVLNINGIIKENNREDDESALRLPHHDSVKQSETALETISGNMATVLDWKLPDEIILLAAAGFARDLAVDMGSINVHLTNKQLEDTTITDTSSVTHHNSFGKSPGNINETMTPDRTAETPKIPSDSTPVLPFMSVHLKSPNTVINQEIYHQTLQSVNTEVMSVVGVGECQQDPSSTTRSFNENAYEGDYSRFSTDDSSCTKDIILPPPQLYNHTKVWNRITVNQGVPRNSYREPRTKSNPKNKHKPKLKHHAPTELLNQSSYALAEYTSNTFIANPFKDADGKQEHYLLSHDHFPSRADSSPCYAAEFVDLQKRRHATPRTIMGLYAGGEQEYDHLSSHDHSNGRVDSSPCYVSDLHALRESTNATLTKFELMLDRSNFRNDSDSNRHQFLHRPRKTCLMFQFIGTGHAPPSPNQIEPCVESHNISENVSHLLHDRNVPDRNDNKENANRHQFVHRPRKTCLMFQLSATVDVPPSADQIRAM